MIQFQSPWWGLLAVPLTVALVLRLVRKPPTVRVPSGLPFARVARGGGGWFGPLAIPAFLYHLGFLLLTVALMRPQFGIERSVRRVEGIDMVIALDASGSMEAYDVPPEITSESQLREAIEAGRIQKRIDIAKQALERFVEKRPNDRIGLIAFGTLPYVASPPTLDHDFLLGHLQRIEAGTLGGGTGIAGPIAAATTRLRESAAKRRVLVLFTDGANNVEDLVTPEQAAKIAAHFEIVIHTVGIGGQRSIRLVGTPFGGTRLFPQQDDYQPDLMRAISDLAGGRYFEAHDQESFNAVMAEIDGLETIDLEQPVYLDYHERFMPWLVAGLAGIALAFALEHTILQVIP